MVITDLGRLGLTKGGGFAAEKETLAAKLAARLSTPTRAPTAVTQARSVVVKAAGSAAAAAGGGTRTTAAKAEAVATTTSTTVKGPGAAKFTTTKVTSGGSLPRGKGDRQPIVPASMRTQERAQAVQASVNEKAVIVEARKAVAAEVQQARVNAGSTQGGGERQLGPGSAVVTSLPQPEGSSSGLVKGALFVGGLLGGGYLISRLLR